MRRLTLGQFAQLAEIAAAVAVVVSLFYVGFELKENTSAVRAATAEVTTSGTRDILMTIASDAELARIVRVGSTDRQSLSLDEAYRFSVFSRQRWLFFQGIWIQRRLGVLDDSVWHSYRNLICNLLDSPGNRVEWAYHAPVLDPEFVQLVEACSGSSEPDALQ